MKGRSEDDVILQLVSCPFLHFQSAVSDPEPNSQIQKSKKTIAMDGEIEKED